MVAVSGKLLLHQGFSTMKEVIDVVERELKLVYNPMHRETKKILRNFNKSAGRSSTRSPNSLKLTSIG